MIDAAKLADRLGNPINRVMTIRTAAMVQTGGGGILRDSQHPADRVIDVLDRLARWCTYRSIPVCGLWVREFGRHHQEHLHIGYYMAREHDQALANQLSDWLDETIGTHDGKESTVYISDDQNWHIGRCIKGGTSGLHIAAYLGKSEPNNYSSGWGKPRRNNLKVKRKQTGGEGPIEGTAKHHYRWGTSLAIGRTQRDRNGFV
jgi:hypothetical protein